MDKNRILVNIPGSYGAPEENKCHLATRCYDTLTKYSFVQFTNAVCVILTYRLYSVLDQRDIIKFLISYLKYYPLKLSMGTGLPAGKGLFISVADDAMTADDDN